MGVSHHAEGEDLKRAQQLNQQVIKLFQQGKYTEAISVAKEVLAIREKALGPDHPDVAMSIENLAMLYRLSDRTKEAEPLEARG